METDLKQSYVWSVDKNIVTKGSQESNTAFPQSDRWFLTQSVLVTWQDTSTKTYKDWLL